MRDYPVRLLAQALSGCGVKLYSLQLGAKETARAAGLIDLTAELSSIDETAALLANLDLVISLDGMLGHLSGALGIPTWVLVDLSPHYVWMAKGNSTPWYGSVRVFRQQQFKNWTSVFDEVRDALRQKVAAASALVAPTTLAAQPASEIAT
jgi:ADP-heptose:LPS heptosyltransferase